MSDKFVVKYNIYGDIDRKPVLGCNTVGLRYNIDWNYLKVRVKTYSRGVSTTRISAELKHELKTLKDMGRFCRESGLSS